MFCWKNRHLYQWLLLETKRRDRFLDLLSSTEEELLCACSRCVALFVPHQYRPLRNDRKMLNIGRPRPRSYIIYYMYPIIIIYYTSDITSFRRRLCSLLMLQQCLPTKARAYALLISLFVN